MKIFLLHLAFSLFVASKLFSQTTQTSIKTNKLAIRAFASIGQSTFKTNLSSPSKFPTTEIRIGAGASVKVNSTIDLCSRFIFGVKAKREPFNHGQYVTVGPPFMGLDEVASYRNHYFFEIPLFMNVNLFHKKLGIQTGLNYRFFRAHNDAVDFLTNQSELGLITGACYNITDKIRIGGSYTFGLTEVYTLTGLINSEYVDMSVKNNFYQLSIEYLIRK
jgi:hypothetical protein